MKKVFALMLAAAMLLMVFGCQPKTEQAAAAATQAPAEATEAPAEATEAPAEATEAPAEPTEEPAPEIVTVNPGVLTIGTCPDFAPYEFYMVGDGGAMEFAGFDIALAQAIADDLGLTLEVKALAFDSILIELMSGTIDLGISGFSPDPERAKSVDFSELYYLGGQSLVVRTEDVDKYTDYASLTGLPVGAQTGSIQMGLAEQYTPDASIVGLETVTGIIMELKSGKLEAAYIEEAVAKSYMITNPDITIAFDVQYDGAAGSAVAIKKGNDALTAAVNATIAKVLADGSMDQFVADANEQAVSDKAQQITPEG